MLSSAQRVPARGAPDQALGASTELSRLSEVLMIIPKSVSGSLASAQSIDQSVPMTDFMRVLRDIRDRLSRQDVTIQDWASAADVSHTTLWRILERGQTPSVSTYAALVAAEKKFAPTQK